MVRRRAEKFAAATGALLLQALFIAAFLYGLSPVPQPRQIEHELTLLLPRLLPQPASVTLGPPPMSRATPMPVVTPPPPWSILPPDNIGPPDIAAPRDALRGIGEALRNCTPENYNNLAPLQRAQCPPPGEGLAIKQAPDPMGLTPHGPDYAYWQEQYTRAHLPPPECPPGPSLTDCQIQQAWAENAREDDFDFHLAKSKAAALQAPRPSSKSVSVHP